MLACLSDLGIALPGEGQLEQELWDYVMRESFSRRFGSKINANRFLGTVHAAHHNSRFWAIDCFVRTYVALELDMLKVRGLAERLQLQCSANEEPGEAPTATSGRLSIEDRSLRAAAQNAISLSVLMLAEDSNRGICGAILAPTLLRKEAYVDHARKLRSVGGSEQWLREQIAEDQFMGHVSALLQTFASPGGMSMAGLACSITEAEKLQDGEIVLADEMAEVLGSMAVNLATCRLRRCLNWLAPPMSLFNLLGDDGSRRQAAVDDFRAHCEMFQRFSQLPGKTGVTQLYFQRHL
jgi:hypothetical protein